VPEVRGTLIAMSQSAPKSHVDLATDLAASHACNAQGEQNRFIAEVALPPIQPPSSADNGLMPASDDQRSEWKRYSYDRPGSEQRSDHGVNQA
jgi:hypothetical protein